MLAKALWNLMDSLRSRPQNNQDNFVVAVALMVWASLSMRDQLTDDSLNFTSTDFETFCRENLGEFDQSLFKKIPGETFDVVSGMTGVLSKFPLHDIAVHNPKRSAAIPVEVADLMVALGQLDSSDKVYCPWDEGGQLSGRVAEICDSAAFVEILSSESIVRLVSFVLEKKPEIKTTDPIIEPSAVSKDGSLLSFDVSIANPPFGNKYHRKDIVDYHNRLPEKTSSAAVLTTHHLLSQTTRRSVVMQPLNILFSSGAESVFRKTVVKKGMVEAVVKFPSGMFDFTNIPFCILLLAPGGGNNEIRFVDVENSGFCSKENRKKVVLEDVLGLSKVILGESDNVSFARNVSTDEVANNNYDLQVDRYIISDELKCVQELLDKSQTVTLSKACQIGKTVSPKAIVEDGEVDVFTFDMSSFTTHGYMKPPVNQVRVDSSLVGADQYLKHNDIVIVSKGSSVGRVGIVPESAPAHGEGGWLPTSLGTVLRCTEDSMIDPRVLFMQLRSSFGHALLTTQAVGASIPVIRVSSLRDMEIVIPDPDECRRLIETFEKEVALQVQIEGLKIEQDELAKQLNIFRLDSN